ncbi:E3 ubiquitin-protein ligase [Canna indica]|uniref:RING-type E3 ubiquitin transferase n=1 Tax=Canna indica TaxID=4628 RepID=A0AAQ3Q9S4_9LILI|nr:E3 ubiquitin-protein ligase [Canna indica]
MQEMDPNRVWSQDDPRISSAPVKVNSMASADIATRTNDHPSSSLISAFPTGATNPGTSNTSYMSTYNGSSRNFPPNQAPNWPACYNQPIRGDAYGTIYPQIDYRRVAFKRKSPVIPQIADGTNATGYPQVGSSSNCPPYPASLEPTINPNPESWPMNTISMPSSYRNDNNIPGEGIQRNVRSRHSEGFHSQFNPAWICASRDMPYAFYPSCNTSDPRMIEQWSHFPSPIMSQGWFPTLDASSLNQRLNQPTARSNMNGSTSATNSAYPCHLNQNRNQGSLSALRCPSIQNMVSAQSGHNPSSSYVGTETSAASVIGMPVGVEAAAPARYFRPLHIIGHPSHGRNRNARDLNQRSHLIFNGHNTHTRWAPEGALVPSWSAFYDSSSLLDQHRDMRMDIDNMSYEELLALEERIGNVNTGLSEEMVSRCMVEAIYHSSHQIQQGKCTICLEEYEDSEKLGRLNCGHDFHVCCISQWLQMKNVCPICREPASSDDSKKQ